MLMTGCRIESEFLHRKQIIIGYNVKKGCKDKRYKIKRFFYDTKNNLIRKEIIKYGLCGVVNELGPTRAIRSQKTIVYDKGKVVSRTKK